MRKKDLSIFHEIDISMLLFLCIIGCYRQIIPIRFVDDSAYKNLILKIFCYNDYFYNLYKSTNVKDNFIISKQKLQNITIKHFLCYLKFNKQYRYQKDIIILKEIDIFINGFALKKSEKIYGHNLVS